MRSLPGSAAEFRSLAFVTRRGESQLMPVARHRDLVGQREIGIVHLQDQAGIDDRFLPDKFPA